ncbi:MAG: cytochrome c oxidase accessory protein CcoG [Piscirickettsiaceae bacterium]|nr:cytochrome c oxidase accessory protein CcoG [Piscirickettsiaceae bacterium]
MSNEQKESAITVGIYQEMTEWHVNDGGSKIVAKRMPGKFRNLKWLGMLTWLPFFLGPYIRWDGSQAILFDIPNQQFHIFDITIFPQDIWMLSLTLLFFAILLAAVTSIAGRVFCGYFCFQTVWTDVFSFIEAKLEGDTPSKAQKFKNAPWTINKSMRVLTKHSLWLMISLLTGLSFVAWFIDVFQLWVDYFTLQAPMAAWLILATFAVFTYGFAGFMREQVCFWLCPYARLQGVMYDQDTVLPAYDAERGEPRGKLNQDGVDSSQGSCIDCKVCVAVCPTGIDIRQGQQEGCITCGICIDACDSIMDKIDQPRGLIRYASYKELHHNAPAIALWKRPRVLIYTLILLSSVAGVVYGFTHLSPTEFKVIHERQPLFVLLSDGSIQNKYTLKLLNKTKKDIEVEYQIEGIDGATARGIKKVFTVEPGKIVPVTAFVKVPKENLTANLMPILFKAKVISGPNITARYKSMFIGPNSIHNK